MPILDNLFGPRLDNMQNALGRATQRHALLTNNLANVNTPGYLRKDIDFNITLKEEMDKTGFNPPGGQTGGALRLDGNGVDLEKEVLSIAETELRYEALTDMTTDYFSGLKNVIREGK
ncbi:MAG: flagellar basal body rod protein FlgB [Fimbriimonadales bacterium]